MREAITWVQLTLFFELAVDAELPYCVEGKPGGRPEHFRYAEVGDACSPATVEQQAAVLASATWALEALVGELLPPAARREPGVGCCRSYYGQYGGSSAENHRIPMNSTERARHQPKEAHHFCGGLPLIAFAIYEM